MAKKQRQPTRKSGNAVFSSNLHAGTTDSKPYQKSISMNKQIGISSTPQHHEPADVALREPQQSQQPHDPLALADSSHPSNESNDSTTSLASMSLRPIPPFNSQHKNFSDWVYAEREGIFWIIGCAAFGAFVGFGVGCGWFTYGYGAYQYVPRHSLTPRVSPNSSDFIVEYVVCAWRVALAGHLRRSFVYRLLMLQTNLSTYLWPSNWLRGFCSSISSLFTISSQGAHWEKFIVIVKQCFSSLVSLLSTILSAPFIAYTSSTIDPFSHPNAFYVLREYIIRFDRGYVHPDLGFLVPAPSGAARGIGMVRNSYTQCQVNCFPGTQEERIAFVEKLQCHGIDKIKRGRREIIEKTDEISEGCNQNERNTFSNSSYSLQSTGTVEEIQTALNHQSTSTDRLYSQEEILLRIPIEAQITRTLALDIIRSLIPNETKTRIVLDELDDAFLLALLLTHETGLGQISRFWPYIATLPHHPTCALHTAWRQSIVDVISAMSFGMGTDVQGWPNEIAKASRYFDSVVGALSVDFGSFLAVSSRFKNLHEALRWSLCQVASRAVAGRDSHGRLRLVPMMDMINHDEAAGKFIEISGDERLEEGFFMNVDEVDAGTFVVRSRRHGRQKTLRKGQELMANYNVPKYTPLDWFLNMGYIPPEREGKWSLLQPGLPPVPKRGFI